MPFTKMISQLPISDHVTASGGLILSNVTGEAAHEDAHKETLANPLLFASNLLLFANAAAALVTLPCHARHAVYSSAGTTATAWLGMLLASVLSGIIVPAR